MTTIYVLKCEKDHYYVGKTSRPLHTRITEHFRENGSEWTKRYPPIIVVEVKEKADEFDEDKYTKMYMKKYGIDRVRGGTYTQLVLPDYLRMTLEKELCSAQDLCFRCNRSGHFVNQCYARTKADGSPLDDNTKVEKKVEDGTDTIQTSHETFPEIIMPVPAKEMRMFIKQKFTELKNTHSHLTTTQSIINALGEVWDTNPHWTVPKPLWPDFLLGCTASWHKGVNTVIITHQGKTYCFPKPIQTMDCGVVQLSRNSNSVIEIVCKSGSQAYLHYVVLIEVQTNIPILSNQEERYEKYGELFNNGGKKGIMSRLWNIGTKIVQEGIKIAEDAINDSKK
jgi:predicted GIY-YIG superfamily endonuclease